MKYLIIEEKRPDIKSLMQIMWDYYPNLKTPCFRNGTPQFYFPKGELTKTDVATISSELGMRVISISNVRAVIGY